MTKETLSKKSEQQDIIQQISELVQQTDLTLPEDNEALWEIAVNSEVHAALHQIKAGMAYKALKEKLQHGEFTEGLKLRGIKPRNAQRNIAVAELVCNAKTTTLSFLTELKYSQLLELTNLPEEKISTLDEEEIQSFAQMPVRALRQEVKQINLQFDEEKRLEKENANLKASLEEAQYREAEAINLYNQEKIKKAPETINGLPSLIAMIQSQIPAISEALHLNALEVRARVDQILATGIDLAQAKQAGEVIANFIYGPYMQLGMAIQELQETLNVSPHDTGLPFPNLDQVTWEEAMARRDEVIREHDARYNPDNFKSKKKGRK